MTDKRRGSAARSVGVVTTAVVTLATAAAVGWAAAVPVGGSGSTASAPPAPTVGAAVTVQRLDSARADLQQVRRDLARLLAREDDMPRAKLARLTALTAQLPSVQVPQSTTAPTITHVTPPVTHTTSGASGARP